MAEDPALGTPSAWCIRPRVPGTLFIDPLAPFTRTA